MSIDEARQILGDKFSGVDDESIRKMIELFESICVMTIEKSLI